MIDFNITEDELKALKTYKENNYEAINQLLVSNAENDIALLSSEVENSAVSIVYNRESVIEYLKNIKAIYRLILKYYYGKKQKLSKKIYRGTNLSEIERIKSELFIDRLLSATDNESEAINQYSANWNRPACMNITLNENVPYVFVRDVLKDKKYKNEILIAPFTKIRFIEEVSEKKLERNSKPIKVYNIDLEKQNLDELTDRERNGVYAYILENAYSINRKLEECIRLEKENATNFENIRKLEQLLSKYENDIEEKEISQNYTDIEREEDIDDIERITKELNELKETSTEMFEIRKEHINFVNLWKRNIAVYMIAECREIEKAFELVYATISEVDSEDPEMDDMAEPIVDARIPSREIETAEVITEEITNEAKEESEEVTVENDDSEEVVENVEVVEKEEEDIPQETTEEEHIEDDSKEESAEDEKEDEEQLSEEEKENAKTEAETIVENIVEDLTKEKVKIQETIVEAVDVLKKVVDGVKTKTSEVAKKIKKEDFDETKVVEIVKEEKNIETNPVVIRVKQECDENIEAVEKLLENINGLITKQQNHAKIAGNIGATYSALNNAFEMRKVSDTLLELLKNVKLRVEAVCSLENEDEVVETLENISKKNIEISTLLNYLNNPKIAARNSKATRFDEMAIIEENELKRGIAERIREIRGEAELKKLKDDLEIIEDKSAFSRFIGIFTGQNKLDEFMIDQIEVRQTAIRRTLSNKMSLAYNYSIHELMAEIAMFIEDNDDDELIQGDVSELKAMADELRRNFVILETKVQSIVYDRNGRDLPVASKRLSRMETIEIETYRFLKKYGYDVAGYRRDEPKYQDTMANEIARIVEYVNSASIF